MYIETKRKSLLFILTCNTPLWKLWDACRCEFFINPDSASHSDRGGTDNMVPCTWVPRYCFESIRTKSIWHLASSPR